MIVAGLGAIIFLQLPILSENPGIAALSEKDPVLAIILVAEQGRLQICCDLRGRVSGVD